MGTNYYVTSGPPCKHCGRGGGKIHIGKSSAGWCFSLHVIEDMGLNSLEDWMNFWDGRRITNEYDEVKTTQEMLSIITERGREKRWDKKPYSYNSWDEFHRMNHSQQGPGGLLRHQIDGSHCVGHGDGTYDLIRGEFF
jgi:hypothetical protein